MNEAALAQQVFNALLPIYLCFIGAATLVVVARYGLWAYRNRLQNWPDTNLLASLDYMGGASAILWASNYIVADMSYTAAVVVMVLSGFPALGGVVMSYPKPTHVE